MITFNGVSPFRISVDGESMGVICCNDNQCVFGISHCHSRLYCFIKCHNLFECNLGQIVMMSMVYSVESRTGETKKVGL